MSVIGFYYIATERQNSFTKLVKLPACLPACLLACLPTLFCHEILGDGKSVTGSWDMTIKTSKTSDMISAADKSQKNETLFKFSK